MNTPPGTSELERSIDEIAFLVRSDHRVGVLTALVEEPRDRAELGEATDASSPTMGRILGDFEERRWVVREGRTYELTRLGEFVADELLGLCESMATERRLRDVWRWLPREMEGFTVDLFEDAVVSYPGPAYPYEPVERITRLIEEAETMRGFGTTILKSSNLEAACRAIVDGADFEYIYSPPVLDAMVSWNPERVSEAVDCDNCTALLHDALPDDEWCGLGIYDHRVGICCHDAETGVLRAVVDTDSSAARSWAESVYERVRAEARPLEAEALTA